MRAIALAACLMLFVVSAEAQQKKAPVLPEGVTVLRDLDYAGTGNPRQTLDLYLPESDELLPLVIWVHGGGWKNGSKDKPKNLFLLEHGFAVASIGYRLLDEAQWPSQIDDCNAAIRFLRTREELDPEKFGIMGGSAGGHLAALVGTRPVTGVSQIADDGVQAVCDWYGPSDLLTMPPNVVTEKRPLEKVAQSNGAKLLGAPVPTIPERAKDASAYHHVSANDPPFLIMHGSEDLGVPIEQSQKLHDALIAAGVDSTLVIVEGAGHGGKEFQAAAVTDQVVAFFRRVLR